MIFKDPKNAPEPGLTRSTYLKKFNADIQLAIEELDHTLAMNNAQVIVGLEAKAEAEGENELYILIRVSD